jgi:hypothetical protein
MMTVAVKKGAILAALAPTVPAAIKTEPFSLVRKRSLERPGAVKGAPLLGAAKRTLDGEDRSGTMRKERKARRSIGETCGQRSGPFAHCHQHEWLRNHIFHYAGFTDIELNPERSINARRDFARCS